MKNFPRIIAICGLKRSGKDTIADYLCTNYGYTKIKIATPLKQGLQSMFGFTDEQLETDKKDEIDTRWGVEPRKVMQFIGTDVMQYMLKDIIPDIGRKIWIKTLIEQHIINTTKNTDKYYVIPDLRFMHEYDELKKYNAVLWRVDRINEIDNMTNACDSHISEKEYLDIPVSHVYKNKTKTDLYSDIDNMLVKVNCSTTI